MSLGLRCMCFSVACSVPSRHFNLGLAHTLARQVDEAIAVGHVATLVCMDVIGNGPYPQAYKNSRALLKQKRGESCTPDSIHLIIFP